MDAVSIAMGRFIPSLAIDILSDSTAIYCSCAVLSLCPIIFIMKIILLDEFAVDTFCI